MILLYLHAHDLSHPSIIYDDQYVKCTLSHLKEIAKQHIVFVLVPAEDVLSLTIKLPKMSRSRLLKAVPFAVEEQLIEDLETSHIAIGTQLEDGTLPVAVVSHKKMQSWQALLKTWQIMPDGMLPLTWILPYHAKKGHIHYDQTLIARTGFFQGFTCAPHDLSSWLSFAIKANPSLKTIDLYNYTAHPFKDLPILNIPITEKRCTAEDSLRDIKTYAQNASPINLLQGPYTIKKTSRLNHALDRWANPKTLAYLGAIWIGIGLLYYITAYLIHTYQTIHRAQQIEAATIKINHLQKPDRALWLLGAINQSRLITTGITIKSIHYQNGMLTLHVSALTQPEITDLIQKLTNLDIRLTQKDIEIQSNRIWATLTLQIENNHFEQTLNNQKPILQSLHYHNISFDRTIQTLTQFIQAQSAVITTLTITPSKTPGIVDLDVVFEK